MTAPWAGPRISLGVASYGQAIREGQMPRTTFLDRATDLRFSSAELCDRTVSSLDRATLAAHELEQRDLTNPTFSIRSDFTDPL